MGKRTRPISTGEYRKLLNRLDERTALAVRISANTGLRVSDVLRLRAEDWRRKITVTERKTGKVRTVHLPESTFRAGRDYIRKNSITGEIFKCNRSTLFRHVQKVARELGFEHVSMHSLRKMYAQKYARKHGLTATQEELQHKYISTTLLYVVGEKELEAVLNGRG